jgi:UDP-N-acetylglucosamine 4,6-dehydratase
MNYLITGANGFLGQELVNKLYTKENKLTLLVREHCFKEISLKYSDALVYPVINYSFTDFSLFKHGSIFDNVDHIFHLAGMKGVATTNKYVKESLSINISGAQHLLDVASSFNVKSVIGISSEKAVHKIGVYGASKFLLEKLFDQYSAENPRTQYKVMRCGNIAYSPNSLLTIWRNNLINGFDVVISHPDATKFLCSVQDAVGFLIETLNHPNRFYVPKIKSIRLGHLLAKMIEKYDPNKKSKVIISGLFPEEEMCEYLDNDYSSDMAEILTDNELSLII